MPSKRNSPEGSLAIDCIGVAAPTAAIEICAPGSTPPV
jgi:hypothetical protein